MDNELQYLYDILKRATRPEEVFGILIGTVEEKLELCTKTFRHLVWVAHPDHATTEEDKKIATEAFKLINPMYELAKNKIKNNTYGAASTGTTNDIIHITSKKNDYILGKLLYSGTIADLFESESMADGNKKKVLLKVARNYKTNEFIKNEFTNLKEIYKNGNGLVALFPDCIDSFGIQDNTDKSIRQVNVFNYDTNLVNLTEVIKQYPDGIDSRDMAWIFKRTLAAIWLTHTKEIVHGAVIPPHILLNLTNHGIILLDWSFSAKMGSSHIKAIDSNYKEYYPKTVFDKKNPTPEIDIYMAAMTMIKLLGGDPATKTIPDKVPKDIRMILRACILDPSGLDDAHEIHEEFKSVIGKLFGPPKFRDLVIKR